VGSGAVEPWAIAQQLGEEVPLARYRLLAAALATLELALDGRVAIMIITDEMVRAAGAKWEHTEGLVGYARALEGVEVGMMLARAREGGTRVSLRSKGRLVDAGAICAPLGGGGHRGAAGCTLPVGLADARRLLLDSLGQVLCTASSSSTSPPG